jgi:hypothetical protein
MRWNVPRLLMVLDAVLLVILLILWVSPDGSLRNTAWSPPAPLMPDLAGMLPGGEHNGVPEKAVSLLEKPLFSTDRAPPPPVIKTVKAQPAPPDPLGNVRVLGIFKSGGSGGILASVDGKPKRFLLNETLGPWTIKSIDGLDVTFAQGSQTRVLSMTRIKGASTYGSAGASANSGAAPKSSPGLASAKRQAGAAAARPSLPAPPQNTTPGYGLIRQFN